jgi:hypothetical protein
MSKEKLSMYGAAAIVIVVASTVSNWHYDRTVHPVFPARTLAWQRFSLDGRFSVSMPPNPTHFPKEANVIGVLVRFTTFTSGEGPWAYTAGYVDWPEAQLGKYPTDDLLEGAALASAFQFGGTLKPARFEFQGLPGLDVSRDDPNSLLRFRSRLIVAGARLYQLVVSAPIRSWDANQADRFFNSLAMSAP